MGRSALLASVAVLAVLVCATIPASAQRVVVFGDSLSDTGNAQVLSGGTSPGSPLGRFSNGLNWVDLLYGTVPAPASTAFATGFLFNAIPAGNVIDYAVGGAFAGSGNIANPALPGVTQEVGLFAALGGTFTARDTVTMWAGANNGNLAVQAPGANTGTLTTAALAAAGSEIANLQALIALGARTVVVLNVPELGGTPALTNAGPTAVAAGNFYSQTFNTALATGLGTLAGSAPGLNIIQADIASLFKIVAANPSAFGFTSITTACLYTGGASCNGLAFADTNNPLAAIHPTQAANAFIAQYIGLLSNPAPAITQASRLTESGLYTGEFVSNQVFDRLSGFVSGTYADRNGPYAEILGQYASYDANGGAPGLNMQLGGLRGGLDRKNGPTLWGGSVTILDGAVSTGSTKSDIQSFHGDIYGTALFGNIYLSADAGLGSLHYSGIKRQTGFPTVVALGTTDGYVATGAAEAGLLQQFGSVTIIPSGRVTYFHTQTDAYNEASDLLAMSFAERQSDSVMVSGKVRAVTPVSGLGRSATAFGEIGYAGYVSTSSDAIKAGFVSNTALPTTVRPGDPVGPGITGRLGLSSQVTEGTFLDFQYGIAVHDNGGETHTGDIRLKATY